MDPVTVYLLAKLRQDVFGVEQQATDPDLDGRDLEPGTWILWAERTGADGTGEPVAHIRVLDDGPNLRIGRLAVRADARTGGIGRRIMRAALDLTEQIDPNRIVKIDAQAYLEDWYVSMGYVTTGEHFMEAGIDHVPMEYRHR